MTDQAPEKLGKYEIVEEVGRGGFAAVYKAVDTTLDRTVALKVLAPHLLWDPTFVERFQREAKVAANLDHPNIVTIYEVDQIKGVYFIAMQFLEGRTLSRILQAEGPLPVPRMQAVVEQIASALDYAHARGFVHRDIKPSNIIVAEDGRVTLTDFGLVKAGEGTQLTASGMVFGTPEYMSPEQAEGKVLDAQSDIYSLGVVLYEMLAGRAPFVADTTPAVMYKHVHEPPPLDELPPDLPQGVVAVLDKALAKKRENRYQSAGEMAQALEEATKVRVEATPIPSQPQVPLHPPLVEKPAAEEVAPPPVEPVAVPKEKPRLPTAPLEKPVPGPVPPPAARPPAPRPQRRPFNEIPGLWLKVTKMTEAFFAQEAPRSSGPATLISLLIFAVITTILAVLSSLISGVLDTSGILSEFAGTPTGWGEMITCFCFGLVGIPLIFYVTNGLNYIGARLLGGTGNFVTQAYLMSLFYVPLGVVTGLLNLVPFVGSFISLAVGIYMFVLSVRAIKVVHQLTTGRAVAAIVWPLLLILLAICLITVLLLVGSADISI